MAKRLSAIMFATTVLVTALSLPLHAGTTCKRPELEWDVWRAHVLANNPESADVELTGEQRANVLDAYLCSKPDRAGCPPDKVVVFYCSARRHLLLVFVKDGCVTKTDEVTHPRLNELLSGGASC